MNVILLKDVEKLGLKGDVVNVARGYARNYLLPRKLAEVATDGRIAEVKRIFSSAPPSPRSRTLARRTSTGPTPVWIARCGPWP